MNFFLCQWNTHCYLLLLVILDRRLAHGCVSPRFIYWELKRYMEGKKKKTDGPYWVVFELIWRDFFKFSAMKYGNKFFFLKGRRWRSV